MTLTVEEVEKIAYLARLELTESQKNQYRKQLSAILDYAEMLSELDLDDIPPTAHAVAQDNVMRPDVIEPSLSIDKVLFNAPRHAQNQFLIQPVLDE